MPKGGTSFSNLNRNPDAPRTEGVAAAWAVVGSRSSAGRTVSVCSDSRLPSRRLLRATVVMRCVASCADQGEGHSPRLKRLRAVAVLTSASKFNIEPNGGIFDVSPENDPM